MKKILFFLMTMILSFALVACDGGSTDNSSESTNVAEDVETEDSVDVTEEPVEKESTEVAETEQNKSEDVPREYTAALNAAQSYADLMHMSKKGIYDQLVSEYGEDFPEDAAQYAIDNVEADWKENALKTAQSYAEIMDMSDNAIYEQLISEFGEQFTEEEAQYAIDNLE